MAVMRANLDSLNIGDTFLTKYEIRGLIGRGGQATVYRSHDTFIDREVAIKIMVDSFDTKREHSRRAQMEARVLCKLHHPNIVHVYDAGATDSGAIYIIMELLKGRTLRDVLRDLRNLTLFETLSIGAQIADGVQLAHHEQVIHRDLKPENVFIVEGNRVKVLDFGIAKFLTLTGITTQRDTLQGTMWYISPEHVQGHGVTVRSDIYALGSILYEAISGTPPCLVGLQEISTQSVAWSQITRVPPQLDELNPSVPGHVARLIQHMLVKEPSERPSSMAEVGEALRTACARLQSESSGRVMAVRELWVEQPALLPVAKVGPEMVPGDTAKDPRVIPVLQPTVEVRQDDLHLDPQAAPGPQADGPAPVESGIIVQDASAADVGSVSRPAETATPHVSHEIRVESSTRAAPSSPEVSSGSFFSNRRRLLVIALVLGTAFGIGLGLSNGFRSRVTKDHSSSDSASAAASSAASIGEQLATARASGSAARPDAAMAPTVAERSPTLLPSSTVTNAARTTRSRTPLAPTPATSKTSAGGGPKPRYSVDDLE